MYATGAAATNLVLSKEQEVKPPTDLTGSKELVFFGTTTTTGLKVGFTGNVPDSLVFGYKRKEFSFIPLGTRKETASDSSGGGGGRIVDVYPAVLTSINTGASTDTPTDISLVTQQFFPTGEVAAELGKDKQLQDMMRGRARDAFEVYRAAVADQQVEALIIVRCFTKVRNDELPAIWADAERHDLFYESDKFEKLNKAYNDAMKKPAGTDQEKEIRMLRKFYADDIGNPDGSTPTRLSMLSAHEKFVCEIAESGN